MSTQHNSKYLIIKTNQYTGNFEREFMAFVFGYEDEYDDEYLARTDFYKAVAEADLELPNEEETPFAPYIDYCGFGTCYQEYHCYEILSHPSNKKYDCDSICIALSSKDMPENFISFMEQRFKAFSEFMASLDTPGIEVLDYGFYKLQFVREDR